MAHGIDETSLFSSAYDSLLADMREYDLSDSDARAILNWFDPRRAEYVSRVDAWQKMLCAGAVNRGSLDLCPNLYRIHVLRDTSFGSTSVMEAEPLLVHLVHQIAKLFFKFRGNPRTKTDFDEVYQRFIDPGKVNLEPHEVWGLTSNLERLEPPPSWECLVGRYGPGVTAEGLDMYGKWSLLGAIPEKVPITLYISSLADYVNLPPIHRYTLGITKVAEVPKSIKSNRLVSSEPANGMFAQLAINDWLYRELHRNFRGHVNLHNQEWHNTLLHDPDYCSIDLSDASDHVSCSLVHICLPRWREFLFSARSEYARLPDGREALLNAFAPMGCGLTFGVLTAISCGILSYACRYNWHAYGDDWIVHYKDYDYVIDIATRCGLKVNKSKSCPTRVYKESCGLELFQGRNITPMYIRVPPSRLGATAMERLLEFFEDGLPMPRLADWLVQQQRCVKPGSLRVNKHLQRWEVGCYDYAPMHPSTKALTGHRGLYRWFCVKAEQSAETITYPGRVVRKLSYQDTHHFPSLVLRLAPWLGLKAK